MPLDITLKEYERLVLKIYYQKTELRLLVVAGFISLVLMLLNWFGVAKIFEDDIPWAPFCLVFINTSLPFTLRTNAYKRYHTRSFQSPLIYTIDDKKISWVRKGSEGYLAWDYITKYELINDFMLLHTDNNTGIYVRRSKLSEEEYNFITSKIKTKV